MVIQGKAPHRSVDLERDEIAIGRQADNDLILDSERVSRKHARIVRQGGRYLLEDLGSFNGTLVNNRKLEARIPRPLHHKDIVQLSDCRLLFLDHNVFATNLGLSIHLDMERIREEASKALEEFRTPDQGR